MKSKCLGQSAEEERRVERRESSFLFMPYLPEIEKSSCNKIFGFFKAVSFFLLQFLSGIVFVSVF